MPPVNYPLIRQPARHHLHNFTAKLLAASAQRHQIYRTLVKVIVHKSVLTRPGRSTLRVRQRHPLILPLNDEISARIT